MKLFFSFLVVCLVVWPIIVAAESIDINTASLTELDKLDGIGPTYAQRIIDARPFSSLDDLLRVKGIGEKTLEKIKIQGLACVNCNTIPQPTKIEEATKLTETKKEIKTNNIVKIYPSGVIFSEILPSPTGPDETDEFFELQNINNFDVDLSGWQIKDSVGAITVFTIKEETKISANGFLFFKRPESKIMLNNDGDELILSNPNGEIVDSTSFSRVPTGQSYNKTPSGWVWGASLTPGAKNEISAPVLKTKSSAKTAKANLNEAINLSLKDDLPKIEKNDNNSIILFFSVLFLAIVFSAITLFIKMRLNNKAQNT